MPVDDDLRRAVASALGVAPDAVTELRRLGGGDISQTATAVVQGTRVFVKRPVRPVPELLTSEAAGLRWLGDAADVETLGGAGADGGAGPDPGGAGGAGAGGRSGASGRGGTGGGSDVAVPAVLGCIDEPDGNAVLVLAHVAHGPPAVDHDARLGRGLATIHRAGATGFGAPWPGFVGSLPVPNDPAPDWPTFYGQRRLLPTARDADDRGALPSGTFAALDRLVDRLPDLLGPPEPPARLHGDLWAGNAMVGPDGGPVLVDPAAHGGHREVDLAMMRLFGGFSPAVFAAYDEAHPLADGHADRVALLQLHPLLVHAALFGGAYGRRARTVIDTYT